LLAGTSLTQPRGLPSAFPCLAFPTCVKEAPVFGERTSVGLDVHARSVTAAAIDGVTGEVFKARLSPACEEIVDWVGKLPGPCAVTYEAGRPGSGWPGR